MQAEAIRNYSETDAYRFYDVQDVLLDSELYDRIAAQFYLSESDLYELSQGEKRAHPQPGASSEAGLFEHSTNTYLDATAADAARADKYLYYECHTALFETVGERGHAEILTYEVDQTDGDAFITPTQKFNQTYYMALSRQTAKWSARRSYIEWHNNIKFGELTRRGLLQSHVAVETSIFPYSAEISQANNEGYNSDSFKAFFRSTHVDENTTVRTIETLSYSDMTPSDVQLLRGYFGLPIDEHADDETVLAQPLLIPRSWYQQNGGIGGLAQLLDSLKQLQSGQAYKFGEAVAEAPNPVVYQMVAQVSAERKSHAEPVVRAFMDDIVGLAQAVRNGEISVEQRRQQTKRLILDYRLELLANDLQLAESFYGVEVAASLDYRNYLVSEGRRVEALALEASLHKEIGTAFLCGMMVMINEEGKVVDENGEVKSDCPEIKNGQSVKCPECSKIVSVIVENKEKLYCPRNECKLSKSGGKGTVGKGSTAKKTAHTVARTSQNQKDAHERISRQQQSTAQNIGLVATNGVEYLHGNANKQQSEFSLAA